MKERNEKKQIEPGIAPELQNTLYSAVKLVEEKDLKINTKVMLGARKNFYPITQIWDEYIETSLVNLVQVCTNENLSKPRQK